MSKKERDQTEADVVAERDAEWKEVDMLTGNNGGKLELDLVKERACVRYSKLS